MLEQVQRQVDAGGATCGHQPDHTFLATTRVTPSMVSLSVVSPPVGSLPSMTEREQNGAHLAVEEHYQKMEGLSVVTPTSC